MLESCRCGLCQHPLNWILQGCLLHTHLSREKPGLSHRVTQIRALVSAHAPSECLSIMGETEATHYCFLPHPLAATSVSLAGSTLPAQPHNVEALKNPVLDHLLCSLFPLPTRELTRAQGFVTVYTR